MRIDSEGRLELRVGPRREFFRNAMFAISFNGIDGDYAEFGCWGAMTFSLAYHESWRCELDLRLWAFDSICGLPGKDASRMIIHVGPRASSR